MCGSLYRLPQYIEFISTTGVAKKLRRSTKTCVLFTRSSRPTTSGFYITRDVCKTTVWRAIMAAQHRWGYTGSCGNLCLYQTLFYFAVPNPFVWTSVTPARDGSVEMAYYIVKI